jgi:hypothetical protein
MTEVVPYLTGPAYVLGEEERKMSDLSGLDALLGERGLPRLPKLLGCGSYFVTQEPYRLVEASLGASLAAAGLEGSAADAVFVSSSNLPDVFADFNRNLGAVLSRHRMGPMDVRAITGNGCVALLSALDLALSAVRCRRYRCVVVVNLECLRVTDDRRRLLSYAMLTDSAASVVVTSRPATTFFAARGNSLCSNAQQMVEGIRADDAAFGASVIATALDRAALRQADVTRVLANNTFLPIKKHRERELGFEKTQLYLENTRRFGHSLAADPLINWVDCMTLEPTASDHLLYAEAEGHSSALVLRRES